MALTDLTIVRRSLTARLFSTIITIALVAVAVALMLVLLAMRDSGKRAFDRGTGNMHILVSADSSPLTSVLNSVFYANAPQRPILWTKYQSLFPRDAGGFVDRRIDFALPVQQGDSFRGFPTMATVPEFFTSFAPAQGEKFEFAAGNAPAGDFDVVLGSEVAAITGLGMGKQLFVTHGYSSRRGHGPAKGDSPIPGKPAAPAHKHNHGPDSPPPVPDGQNEEEIHAEFPFTVVGVLKPTGSAHDRAVFVHLHATWLIHADEKRHAVDPNAQEPTVANLRNDEKLITGVYLAARTRPGSDVSSSIGPLFSQLRADPTLTVALPGAEITRLFAIVGSIDKIIIAIAAAVLVSSGFSIMLALYNSMAQRRRQIAVLRVLGASRLRVFGLILTESAIIGFLGAIGGVLLSLLSLQAVALTLKRQLGLVVNASLEAPITIPVVAGAVIIAALAGIVPAVMAYSTSVSKHLRPLG